MMAAESSVSPELLSDLNLTGGATLHPAEQSKCSSKASSVAGEMTGKLEEEDFLDDPSFVKVGFNSVSRDTSTTSPSADTTQDNTAESEGTAGRSSFSIIDGSSSFETALLAGSTSKDDGHATSSELKIPANAQAAQHGNEVAQHGDGASLLNYFGMATGDDFLRSAPARPHDVLQSVSQQGSEGIAKLSSTQGNSVPVNALFTPTATTQQVDIASPFAPAPQQRTVVVPEMPSTANYSPIPLSSPQVNGSYPAASTHSHPSPNPPTYFGGAYQPNSAQYITPQLDELKLTNSHVTPVPPSPGQVPTSSRLAHNTFPGLGLPVSSPSLPTYMPLDGPSVLQPHLSNQQSHASMLAGPVQAFQGGIPGIGASPKPFIPPVYDPTNQHGQQHASPQIFVPQQPVVNSAVYAGQTGNPVLPPPLSQPSFGAGPDHPTSQGYQYYQPPLQSPAQSQYDLEEDEAGYGLWNWLKMTVKTDWSVNAHKFGQQLLQKTKIATDTVLTTLDPGMEEYLRPVMNLAIDSRNQDVAQGLRQGFRSVFGHTVARGKDVCHDLAPLLIGIDNGMTALEQKFSKLSCVDFQFTGHHTMLGCEVVLAQLVPQRWSAMYMIGLRDAAANINLYTLSQPIAVPASCAQTIMHNSSSDFNQLAQRPTWDDIVYGYKQVSPDQDWCCVLAGIPKQAVLAIAAQCLAAEYQHHLQEQLQQRQPQNFMS